MKTLLIRILPLALLLVATLPQAAHADDPGKYELYNGCWRASAPPPYEHKAADALYLLDMRNNQYAVAIPKLQKYVAYYNYTRAVESPGSERERLAISYGGDILRAFLFTPTGMINVEGPSAHADWVDSGGAECEEAELAVAKELSQAIPRIWGKWRGELDGEDVLIELDEEKKTMLFPAHGEKSPHTPIAIGGISENPDDYYDDTGKYRIVLIAQLDQMASSNSVRSLPLILLVPTDPSAPLLWESIYPLHGESKQVVLTKQ